MNNALGYVRVSTENQVKEGYSIEEQKEQIEKYCLDINLNLVDIFKDEGKSGAIADDEEMTVLRDGFLDMMARVKEGDIQYIVVLSTNRLWRTELVKAIIHRDLKRHGVDIKAIDRPTYSIYANNPNDKLINGVFELLDEYERSEITVKLKRGRKKKAEGGGYSGGGAPMGYRSVRGSKELVIDDREAAAVKMVFRLKEDNAGITLKMIADIMNIMGYRSNKGKGFTAMLVNRILDREDFYRGIYKYSGVESIGKHKPIL